MMPNGRASLLSVREGCDLRWNETTIATDTIAMYTERRSQDRKALSQVSGLTCFVSRQL